MRKKPPFLHYLVHDQRWKKQDFLNKKKVSAALEKAADVLNKDFSSQTCTLVLSNDSEVQDLNKRFRHRDAPTNVLSFPAEEPDHLGDIIVAYETTEKEALEEGISLLDHTLHLIVHGFLHLLGYDHGEEKEAERMENLEILILQALQIANPYEEQ